MIYPAALRVVVCLEDLRLGRMANCLMCPIARAIRSMGYEKFSVTEKEIGFDNGVTYRTGPAAAHFIRLYDAGYMPHSRIFTFYRTSIPAAVLAAEVVLA